MQKLLSTLNVQRAASDPKNKLHDLCVMTSNSVNTELKVNAFPGAFLTEKAGGRGGANKAAGGSWATTEIAEQRQTRRQPAGSCPTRAFRKRRPKRGHCPHKAIHRAPHGEASSFAAANVAFPLKASEEPAQHKGKASGRAQQAAQDAGVTLGQREVKQPTRRPRKGRRPALRLRGPHR